MKLATFVKKLKNMIKYIKGEINMIVETTRRKTPSPDQLPFVITAGQLLSITEGKERGGTTVSDALEFVRAAINGSEDSNEDNRYILAWEAVKEVLPDGRLEQIKSQWPDQEIPGGDAGRVWILVQCSSCLTALQAGLPVGEMQKKAFQAFSTAYSDWESYRGDIHREPEPH